MAEGGSYKVDKQGKRTLVERTADMPAPDRKSVAVEQNSTYNETDRNLNS